MEWKRLSHSIKFKCKLNGFKNDKIKGKCEPSKDLVGRTKIYKLTVSVQWIQSSLNMIYLYTCPVDVG